MSMEELGGGLPIAALVLVQHPLAILAVVFWASLRSTAL